MRVRVEIEYKGECHVIFCYGIEVIELSKMIRGGRDTGFFYVNPGGGVVLIGSDLINGGLITVDEDE